MHVRLHPCRRICCVQVPEDCFHVCSVHMCVYSDPRKHSCRESRARLCCYIRPKYCTADEPSFCRRSVTFGLTTMPLRQLDPSMRMCRLFAIQVTRMRAFIHPSITMTSSAVSSGNEEWFISRYILMAQLFHKREHGLNHDFGQRPHRGRIGR